ncbi:hypothetical protein [Arthrobacter rhombi]|uniref:hypothetical protein n=1 Tax=Arthrobacter rhombi TaxID=71253 RepID=UPI003FD28D56
MDLARWFADKRWVALLELIDGLPATSRLNEAIMNNPDDAMFLADRRLEAQNNKGSDAAEPWSPRQAEYGLDQQMWSAMISLLIEIKQGITAQAGGKPKPEKPFPVPRTEVDRLIEAAEHDWTVEFLQELGFDASDI